MPDDRRTARRVRLPGVQVTYESATGERRATRAEDLSREGLFLPCDNPLRVGARLSLEIQPIGELVVWSALGRVVWVREVHGGAECPAGMAVKIIDADDAVRAAIDRLLDAREPTERGLGAGDMILPNRARARSNPPAREKTMLGVGAETMPAPAAPIVMAGPAREPTLVGVGVATPAEPIERDTSLAIDLVAVKHSEGRRGTQPLSSSSPLSPVNSERFESRASRPSGSSTLEDERFPLEPPVKRRSGAALAVLAILLSTGIVAYLYRAELLAAWQVARSVVEQRLR